MNLIPNPQEVRSICSGSYMLRYDHRITLDLSCGVELLDTFDEV